MQTKLVRGNFIFFNPSSAKTSLSLSVTSNKSVIVSTPAFTSVSEMSANLLSFSHDRTPSASSEYASRPLRSAPLLEAGGVGVCRGCRSRGRGCARERRVERAGWRGGAG